MNSITPLLQGLDLACIRDDRSLFSELSFVLGAGEVLLLEGENGSGKTSLLRILCGFREPDAGQVSWCGGAISTSAYRANMAFVGHLDGVKKELTVLENLRVALALGQGKDSARCGSRRRIDGRVGMAGVTVEVNQREGSRQRRGAGLAGGNAGRLAGSARELDDDAVEQVEALGLFGGAVLGGGGNALNDANRGGEGCQSGRSATGCAGCGDDRVGQGVTQEAELPAEFGMAATRANGLSEDSVEGPNRLDGVCLDGFMQFATGSAEDAAGGSALGLAVGDSGLLRGAFLHSAGFSGLASDPGGEEAVAGIGELLGVGRGETEGDERIAVSNEGVKTDVGLGEGGV